MGDVVKLPVEKQYPRTVRGKEIWAQPEPPDEMVWEICPYVRSRLERCRHCPKSRIDPDYGAVTDGCYVMAQEACRGVFAIQARQKRRKKNK